jgi:protein SCO1/2
MSRKGIIYTVFFVVLGVVFYAIVSRWIVRNDTISEVQPFAFTNQDGHRFTDKDVQGKVYVAEFFYTTCPGICPRLNANMLKVYEAFKDRKDFMILSHTCMPEVDSAEVLKHYADSLKVNTNQWVFLTGRKDSLYNAARVSYTLDDPLNNLKDVHSDFLHTQFWALVNKEGKVKKVYDGLRESEVKALIKQVKHMLD